GVRKPTISSGSHILQQRASLFEFKLQRSQLFGQDLRLVGLCFCFDSLTKLGQLCSTNVAAAAFQTVCGSANGVAFASGECSMQMTNALIGILDKGFYQMIKIIPHNVL